MYRISEGREFDSFIVKNTRSDLTVVPVVKNTTPLIEEKLRKEIFYGGTEKEKLVCR